MLHEGAIVTQLAGKRVPKQYLEYALANRTGYVGCAIPTDKGLMHACGTEFDLENVEITQEQCPRDPQVWYFARFGEGLSSDDFQPYLLLKSANNEPLLCCFLSGEFEPDFNPLDGSPHTADYYVVRDYLTGKVEEIYKESGFNVSLMVKELKRESVYRDIKRNCRKSPESKMQITMVASDGSIWSYSTLDPSNFEWGTATESFGFTEGKVENKPLEKKGGLFGPPSKPAEVVPPPASVPTIPPKESPLPDEEGEEYKDTLFVPGDSVLKGQRSVIKAWYKHWSHDNKCPPNWEQGKVPIVIRKNLLKNIKAGLVSGLLRVHDPKPIASTEPVKPVIVVPGEMHTGPLSMIMKPEKREIFSKELLPRVLCTRDEKGQVIIDPNKLAEWEANVPTVELQMGQKPDSFIFDVESFRATMERFPEFALRKFLELQSQRVLLANQLASLESELKELKSKNVKQGLFGKTA